LLPSLVRPIHPWHDVRALLALTSRFRLSRPHIVHTHSGKAGFLGRLAAHRARVPIIVHTIHGPSFGPFQGRAGNLLFRTAESMAGRITTHFVTVAHAMRDQYLAADIGRPDQYSRIFSGFPLEPFLQARPDPSLQHRLGIAATDITIGMIARLFRLKGHDDLLEASPELLQHQPNLRFLLIGDGAWRSRLLRKALRLGVAHRYSFAGLVPPEQIPDHVALMHMLVHLSRREGLPRALPQALAAARPVIAYDCDGAGEICLETVTGFLIRPGDSTTLIDRILKLARDPDLRRRLGQEGQNRVRELFPLHRMIDDLDRLYRRLAQEGPPIRTET
jgi:glycosyltransferase involved in cell wall biosynthesis